MGPMQFEQGHGNGDGNGTAVAGYPPAPSPSSKEDSSDKTKLLDRTWDTAFGKIGPKTFFRRQYLKGWIIAISIAIFASLLTIYHKQIVTWLRPMADDVKKIKFGWLIFVGVLFVISFPPLFGHEIVTILCGLIYGLWAGFGVVALGTFIGELGNYVVFKWLCTGRSKAWEQKDLTYATMCIVVREGGFWIAFLARLSAIPGHLVTPVFATTGMPLWIFLVATIVTLPKQLAAVYLGTLFDVDASARSTASKMVEYAVLAVAFLVTIGAAVYIYGKMSKQRPLVQAEWARRDAAAAARLNEEGFSLPSQAAYAQPPDRANGYEFGYAPATSRREQYKDPRDPRAHYRRSDGTTTSLPPVAAIARGRGQTYAPDGDDEEGLVAGAAKPGYSQGGISSSTVDLQAPGGRRPEDGEFTNGKGYGYGYKQAADGSRHEVGIGYGYEASDESVNYMGTGVADEMQWRRAPGSGVGAGAGVEPGQPIPSIAFHPASGPDDSFMDPGRSQDVHTQQPLSYAAPRATDNDVAAAYDDDEAAFYKPRVQGAAGTTGGSAR